jgi:hypothetical protein
MNSRLAGERKRLPSIDPLAAQKIQPELLPNEKIYWAAMPSRSIIFHSDDWTIIPFTLVWSGFFVFWEREAVDAWRKFPNSSDAFMVVWGIPFLCVGVYMLVGRFFHDAWLKRRTYYAATNRRVLIVQDGVFEKCKTKMVFLEAVPDINREGAARGTIWLGEKFPLLGGRRAKKRSMSRFSLDYPLTLADIDDVRGVEQLIADLRTKAKPSGEETRMGFRD